MSARKQWEELYEAAILETDRSKLNDRIDAALAALTARLNEINQGSNTTPEERGAIDEAQKGLQALRAKAPPSA